MNKAVKIVAAVLGSIFALALILILAALVVVRTGSFQNFARQKIISSVEDSTGGKVDIQSFQFDSNRMTAIVNGFVLHGTEPAGAAPLFEAQQIVLAVKLLSALRTPFVLEYLGVDRPQANVMVFPDGHTNIPEPRKKSTSNKSTLETVVNLAIRRIEIDNGALHLSDRSMPIEVRGDNFRLQLAYNLASEHYQGNLSLEPVVAQSAGRPPFTAKIEIPLDLAADAIQITGAKIATQQSNIYADASIRHMASPLVSAQVVAHVGLDEIARSVDVPIHPKPGLNTVEATFTVASTEQSIQIQNALLTLGRTRVSASGDLKKGAQIQASLFLNELGTLLALPERPSGVVEISGTARMPLAIDGSIATRDLAYQQFRNVNIAGGFHADSNTVAVNGLTVAALGGELRADGRLETASKKFSVTGSLRDFTIRNLAANFMRKPIDYAGAIGGSIQASGQLNGEMQARAQLRVSPSGRGVPVSGNLDASYAHNLVSLSQSRISLPNTRIDLSGVVGQTADVRIESHSLDDFSPIANVGSTIRLKGGAGLLTLHESGPLSDPRITGRARLTNFTLENRPFDLLSADLQAAPSRASLENGLLKRNGTQAQFSGSIGLNQWKAQDSAPISAKLTTQDTDVADLLALAGTQARVTGPLNANVAIGGTLSNPQGTAQIAAGPGTAYDEPYDGVRLIANLADQRVDLQTLEARAHDAVFQATGSFTHPRDSFTTGRVQLHAATNQIRLSQFKTLEKQRPGISGIVAFDSDVLGELQKSDFVPSAVNARLTATGLRDNSEIYGNLNATATTYGSELNTRIDSDAFGSQIRVTARTQLKKDYPSVADATIRALHIEKVTPRAKGVLSANAHFEGTTRDPRVGFSFEATSGSFINESFTRLSGKGTYTNQLATLLSLNIESSAGAIDAHGAYAPKTGKIEAHVNAPSVRLNRVANLIQRRPGLDGTARLTGDLSGDLRDGAFLPSNVDLKGGIQDLRLENKALGGLTFEGHTAADTLAVTLNSDLAGSRIHATGQVQLRGDYNGSAKLTIANVKYSSIAPLIGSDLPMEAQLEAQADFSGPFRRPANGSGSLQISKLEVSSTPAQFSIHNDGPIALRLTRSEIQVQQAKLTGPKTNFDLQGTIGLNRASPLDLSISADTDLAVVKSFDPTAFASGSVVANATVRGAYTKPQVNGRIDLKDASLEMGSWPNGISHANGTILLNGTNARINSLTAETGGGKISIDGTAGYAGSTFDFNLHATAQNVRTRVSGASVTSTASLTMSGTAERGLLRGNVTISRVGYTAQSDIGAMLTRASTPPSASTPGIASRIRMNIRVQTAPGVRIQTSVTEQLTASADLTVLGTLQSPGVIGRVNISAGTLTFFGNKYTVNRGSIGFYDATAIQPVLDIDLQTAAQGVTVDLGVNGPIDNLKLSYRSDPPLKFEEIVALLAAGRTPADPTIAVNQPAPPDQSTIQMGESALLGQAIANPVANRLSRVFGVTALKIAPTFQAGSVLPQARITVEQQVSSAVTFTYSQDLSQANALLVRVEFQMSPRFSAVATRDENGVFGLDFFWKKQFH